MGSGNGSYNTLSPSRGKWAALGFIRAMEVQAKHAGEKRVGTKEHGTVATVSL